MAKSGTQTVWLKECEDGFDVFITSNTPLRKGRHYCGRLTEAQKDSRKESLQAMIEDYSATAPTHLRRFQKQGENQ